MRCEDKVRSFLDLSTLHLDEPSIIVLGMSVEGIGKMSPLSAVETPDGYWVWVNEEPERMLKGNIPDTLYALFERALALGCAYILFDRDAEPCEDLPVFDEATFGEEDPGTAEAVRRAADKVDGYDRDNLGESPDY